MTGHGDSSDQPEAQAQAQAQECKEEHVLEHDVYDVFRHSLVRYLGYTNELGEAFKPFIPRSAYLASYGVASCYALADAAHKGSLEYQYSLQHHIPREPKIAAVGAVADTAIWQALASVAIPGFTINRIVAATRYLTARSKSSHPVVRFIPTIAGLAAIPFIIKPIDKLVDTVMDAAIRPPLLTAVESLSARMGYGCDGKRAASSQEQGTQEQSKETTSSTDSTSDR